MSHKPESEGLEPPPLSDEEIALKLISPNGFDGAGPVPEMVRDAAKLTGRLRARFMLDGSLTKEEAEGLFAWSAIQAEWMRELYEARDAITDEAENLADACAGYAETIQSLTAQVEKLQRERDELREANKSYNGREQTIIAAEAENAKLRDVVEDLLTESQRVYPDCPHRNYSEDGECPLCAATTRARAALDHLGTDTNREVVSEGKESP